jgi:hypothetical protein
MFVNIVAKSGQNGSTHETKLCLRAFGQPFSVPSFNSFKKVKITAPYTAQPMQLDKTQDQPA